MQLSSLKHWKDASPDVLLVSSEYIRDNIGNPEQMSWDSGSTTTTCTYDDINRITAADYPTGTDGDFDYDWVGNRSGEDWNLNAVDELTMDGFGDLYGFDPMYGNLDERNDYQTYEYDDYNLLKRIDWYGDAYTIFTSDAAGNRVYMKIDDQGGPSYEFVYDTTADIPAVLAEKGTGVSTKLYIRTPDGRLIAQCHISSGDAVLDHYYHFDGLGSTQALTSSNGTKTDEFKYDVWGNVTRVSGSTEQPYLFVGQLGYYTHYQDPFMDPLDTEIQAFYKNVLLQLGVRYYQPSIGRFTQRDPVNYGLNPYPYAQGNPASVVDATGLKSMKDMTCQELTDKINERYREVRRRWNDLREDRGNLSRLVCCTDLSCCSEVLAARSRPGAEEAYRNAQQNLRDLLFEFENKDCHRKGYKDKIPENAWQTATAPVPQPAPRMECAPYVMPWPSFPMPVPVPAPAPILVPVPI